MKKKIKEHHFRVSIEYRRYRGSHEAFPNRNFLKEGRKT